MIFALIGNQNCGKTTLFNQLTGSNQHVGNFPGVTVERKEGQVKKHPDITVVDLPGIYSLSPYTSEELVSRNYLLEERPDAIINIIDGTNIERNLYLTLQLMELGLPMVIAMNMMDEVRLSGTSIDVLGIEKRLTVPVVPISASKNEGVAELLEHAVLAAERKAVPLRQDFCTGAVHKAIHSVSHLIEEKVRETNFTVRFAATKLIENDAPMQKALRLSDMDLDIIEHIVAEMESELGTDREAALADMRYSFIEELCDGAVVKQGESPAKLRSDRIDRVLTHKILAIPIFLGIMLLIFYITFGPVGTFLGDGLGAGIDALTRLIDGALTSAGVSFWMHSLIVEGILAGVGSILSFLPIILLLFFFLSMLEDSGYMARIAFVMDRLLRRLGLSGRSFVPMLIGFGCSVPAILSTRTLSSDRDRKMTIMLTPFMSCSAKLPIYAVFTAAFFPGNKALVMLCLYALGILVAVCSALILKRTAFRGNPVPFVMELPVYRFPTPKNVGLHMWEKASDFIRRAFSIILVASVVIWFLQSFDWTFNLVTDNSKSILAGIGMLIAPIFAPLGFGDWRMSTAIVTGLTAKETVVSTLGVLTGAGTDAAMNTALQGLFTPLSACAFLAFVLLYMPCVASLAATRHELGTRRGAILTALFQTCTAWVVAFIVFQAGTLLGL